MVAQVWVCLSTYHTVLCLRASASIFQKSQHERQHLVNKTPAFPLLLKRKTDARTLSLFADEPLGNRMNF